MSHPSPSPEDPARSGLPQQGAPSPEQGEQRTPEQGQQVPPGHGSGHFSAPAQPGRAPQTAHGTPYPSPQTPQQQYAQQQQQPHAYHQAQYPQAPIYYQQVPPRPVPVIDGKELRPRSRWYWIGGLTIPVGVLVAVLVFVGLLLSATAEPEFIAEFQGGDSATFQVEEGQEGHWGLYVEGSANRFACVLDTPSGPGSGNDNLETAPHSYSDTAQDGWKLTAELSTPEPGEYVLHCDDLHTGTYGIGTLEQTASAEAKLITAVLVLVILIPVSLIAGVVILIITGVRRSSHRNRLIRERMQASVAPQGPPPSGSAPGGAQH